MSSRRNQNRRDVSVNIPFRGPLKRFKTLFLYTMLSLFLQQPIAWFLNIWDLVIYSIRRNYLQIFQISFETFLFEQAHSDSHYLESCVMEEIWKDTHNNMYNNIWTIVCVESIWRPFSVVTQTRVSQFEKSMKPPVHWHIISHTFSVKATKTLSRRSSLSVWQLASLVLSSMKKTFKLMKRLASITCFRKANIAISSKLTRGTLPVNEVIFQTEKQKGQISDQRFEDWHWGNKRAKTRHIHVGDEWETVRSTRMSFFKSRSEKMVYIAWSRLLLCPRR